MLPNSPQMLNVLLDAREFQNANVITWLLQVGLTHSFQSF